MKIRQKDGNIFLDEVIDFNVEQTLECGQCFHFEKITDMEYVVIAYKKILHIRQEENTLIFFDKTIEEVQQVWIPYFDLDRDYAAIKNSLLQCDRKLENAITEKYGVRIMNQEFYEMLISYIISQNKQIPHIKKIVFDMSHKYGRYLGTVNGRKYYSFPDIETLSKITESEFRELKTGFRAPYLLEASKRLGSSLTYEVIKNMNYEDAKKKLMEIKGVGEKVANCVLLFSLSHRNAFPVDVWIKRLMETQYFEGKDTPKEKIMNFAKELYGEYAGYAQQYIFFYGRDKK